MPSSNTVVPVQLTSVFSGIPSSGKRRLSAVDRGVVSGAVSPSSNTTTEVPWAGGVHATSITVWMLSAKGAEHSSPEPALETVWHVVVFRSLDQQLSLTSKEALSVM